ncbi:hypothetical protein U3516DRAFT_769374, partial [Neocallimastix sp. 'constans']
MINSPSSKRNSTHNDDLSIVTKKNGFNESSLRESVIIPNSPNINNLVIDHYLSPTSECENSPLSATTKSFHNESFVQEEEFNLSDVGNLKKYLYFVSLLNQNFSFKDFAILKITDDNIKLAVVPKNERENYSKYFFDPLLNIKDLDEKIINSIFRNHSINFQVSPIIENDSENTNKNNNNTNNNNSNDDNNIFKEKENDIKNMNDNQSFKENNENKKKADNDNENEKSSSENNTKTPNSTKKYNWDLINIGNPSDLIILDIEKLFKNTYCAKGSMFKGNSNIFQFNTENNVYLLQTSSKSKKNEICNIIRIIGGMQNPIQKSSHSSWNPKMDIIKHENENEENIIKYLFTTFKKYERTTTELENELREKTKLLKEILEDFNNLSKSNMSVIKDLQSAKEQNIVLQEKINDMKEENESSVNKIRLLHMRLENNKKTLNACQKM